MGALVERAIVRTIGDVSGAWDAVDNASLACLTIPIHVTGVGNERAELLGRRRLLSDPAYEIPEGARLEIGTKLWDVAPGSIVPRPNPDGTFSHWECELVRVV